MQNNQWINRPGGIKYTGMGDKMHNLVSLILPPPESYLVVY